MQQNSCDFGWAIRLSTISSPISTFEAFLSGHLLTRKNSPDQSVYVYILHILVARENSATRLHNLFDLTRELNTAAKIRNVPYDVNNSSFPQDTGSASELPGGPGTGFKGSNDWLTPGSASQHNSDWDLNSYGQIAYDENLGQIPSVSSSPS
jgi:hypothetical protein